MGVSEAPHTNVKVAGHKWKLLPNLFNEWTSNIACIKHSTVKENHIRSKWVSRNSTNVWHIVVGEVLLGVGIRVRHLQRAGRFFIDSLSTAQRARIATSRQPLSHVSIHSIDMNVALALT